MKILHRDPETGLVRVRPDVFDDLWHLSHVVEPGDVASALTFRTPEEPSRDRLRGGKVEKRPMHLGVRVETVEFHEFSDRLRLLGPIVEGPQDVGQYHTINVEPGTDVGILKPRGWKRHHFERLEEAVAAGARPLVTLLAIEENEAVVATLRQMGVQRNAEVSGHASGKRYESGRGAEEDFFKEVLDALRDYRPEGAPLLVLGPGFAKERLLAYAREKRPADVKGAVVEGTGQAGMAGIHEALKRGVVDRVSKDQRVAIETRLVERVLEALARDEPVTYGAEQVRSALDAGAAELVLVTDTHLRERGEVLLELARGTGAQAHVVSTSHQAGKELGALGGVAALLRYRLP